VPPLGGDHRCTLDFGFVLDNPQGCYAILHLLETHDHGLTIIRQGWLWAAFAISAYYPLINLGATAGFESGSITTLLQGPGVLWSFGPSVVATILISVGGARSPIRRTERFHLGTVPIKNNKAITRFGQSCRNARTHIAETDETELAASEFVSRGLLISQSDLSRVLSRQARAFRLPTE
jgi:hypothetical protein